MCLSALTLSEVFLKDVFMCLKDVFMCLKRVLLDPRPRRDSPGGASQNQSFFRIGFWRSFFRFFWISNAFGTHFGLIFHVFFRSFFRIVFSSIVMDFCSISGTPEPSKSRSRRGLFAKAEVPRVQTFHQNPLIFDLILTSFWELFPLIFHTFSHLFGIVF